MHAFTARPYRQRPIGVLGVDAFEGWRFKVYSTAVDPPIPDRRDFAGALELARAALPIPAVVPGRPGVGFVILHRGAGVDYLVLCWWDRENELPTRVFVREPGREWRRAGRSESFCVWDLEVMAAERDAFVETVLTAGASDLEAYLHRVAPRAEVHSFDHSAHGAT